MNKNLFYYATSELSQDAFLCWLLSHGDVESRGTRLHECAISLLRKMCKGSCNPKEVVFIQRQYKGIDVLVEAIAEDDLHYYIIIEDKIGTDQHDDQLNRYKDSIRESMRIPTERIVGVYYKSGLQGCLEEVMKSGYNIMLRGDILEALSPYANDSEILKDYYDHLYDAHMESERYRDHPYREWDWPQIEAFYDALLRDEKLCETIDGYEYVHKTNGAFYGLWFKGTKLCNKSWSLYLQLEFSPEQAKICLKGEVDAPNPDIKAQGNAFIDRIVHREKEAYAFWPWFERPGRLEAARHMTLGVRKLAADDLYAEELKSEVINAVNSYHSLRAAIENKMLET